MHTLAFITIHSFRSVPSRAFLPLSQSSISPSSPLRSHPVVATMNPHSHAVITESTPLISTSNNTSQTSHQPLKWRDVWSITSRYVIPADRRSKLLALCTLFAVLLRRGTALIQPFAYKLAVDALASAIIPGHQLRVPYGAVGLYILAQLGSTLFSAIQDAGYAYLSSDYQKRFSVDLFSHLQSLSLAYHMHRKTGEVLKIMDRGENSIDVFTTSILFTLLPTYVFQNCPTFFPLKPLLHFTNSLTNSFLVLSNIDWEKLLLLLVSFFILVLPLLHSLFFSQFSCIYFSPFSLHNGGKS